MVGYLGLPPLEYIQRSEVTQKVFDEQGQCFSLFIDIYRSLTCSGNWKSAGALEISPVSLEESQTVLDGADKEQFLNFIRSMLRWLPEERKRASELLADPWLEGAIS